MTANDLKYLLSTNPEHVANGWQISINDYHRIQWPYVVIDERISPLFASDYVDRMVGQIMKKDADTELNVRYTARGSITGQLFQKILGLSQDETVQNLISTLEINAEPVGMLCLADRLMEVSYGLDMEIEHLKLLAEWISELTLSSSSEDRVIDVFKDKKMDRLPTDLSTVRSILELMPRINVKFVNWGDATHWFSVGPSWNDRPLEIRLPLHLTGRAVMPGRWAKVLIEFAKGLRRRCRVANNADYWLAYNGLKDTFKEQNQS
jgi:hypothetical protein